MYCVRGFVAGLALAAAACGGSSPPQAPAPALAAAPPAVDSANAGAITGKVVFSGTPPKPQTIRLDGDSKCVAINGGPTRQTEDVVLGDGNTLQNVFVYVKDGLKAYNFPIPNEPAVIDQQKCRYLPRVVGVRVGQPLEIRNSDPLLHNVRGEGAVNQPFNVGQPVQGVSFTRTFSTTEVMMPVKCDVHAWMRAFVGVVDNPFYATTGPGGTFSLKDLPPGTYTLEAWHETFGTQTATVTIGAKETKDVTFTFAR